MPYLTPEEIPGDDVCRPLYIPNSSDWLAIVSGLLTEGTKPWNWEQSGAVTVEQACVLMQQLVDAYYNDACGTCLLPGGEPVTQLDELGQWRMLDGGVWVAPFGDGTIPTLPEIDAPTNEERRCLAAKNAVLVLEETYESWTDSWGAELALSEAITDAAEVLALRVGVWLGFLSAGQAILLFALFQVFYELMESITADLWTSDFTDKLTCIFLNNAGNVGDTVVFDFNGIRLDMTLQTDWFDPTLSDIRLLGQVQYLLQFVGAEGINHAGATTTVTDTDCSFCDETWCYEWNDVTGFGDWEIYPGQPGTLDGDGFHTGLVFVGGDPLRGRQQTIIRLPGIDSSIVLTGMNVWCETTLGNVSAPGLTNGLWRDNFGTALATSSPADGNFELSFNDPDGITSLDDLIAFLCVGGCETCGDPGGVGLMNRIQLTGIGELPSWFTGGEDCS